MRYKYDLYHFNGTEYEFKQWFTSVASLHAHIQRDNLSDDMTYNRLKYHLSRNKNLHFGGNYYLRNPWTWKYRIDVIPATGMVRSV